MNRKRIVVFTFSLITLVVPAFAAPSATQIRVPVTFTLTPARCPELQVTVNGSGERFLVINHRIDEDGVDHINMNDLINGSATGPNTCSATPTTPVWTFRPAAFQWRCS